MPHDEADTDRNKELWEHIRSLQAQIDRLVETDEGRLRRLKRLEADRQVLRDRLEAARKQLRQRRIFTRRPSHDLDSHHGHAMDSGETPAETALDVPGIGVIKAAPLAPTSPRRDLEVATILDPFSAFGFAPEFRTRPLSALTWRETLERAHPDLLLVESAYRGHDGSWSTRIARLGSPSPFLVDLVGWFRSQGIPTVFWNKEDPVNFDWFIESAGLFDFVFTVDGDQTERYRRILGHDRVQLLQFFAQPSIHFPAASQERTGSVAFAGSYYAAKHPERRQQIDTVVDPARQFGLHIFDRHGTSPDGRFAWPSRYQSHIVGSLDYLDTVEAYRRYKVFLNVNTVVASPTMCARRVFELAACGTPMVSGSSAALDRLGAPVWQVRTSDETTAALERLLGNEEVRAENAADLLAWVSDGHTASDRVETILETVGLS